MRRNADQRVGHTLQSVCGALRRQPSEARVWNAPSSFAEASEDILLSLRERRMVVVAVASDPVSACSEGILQGKSKTNRLFLEHKPNRVRQR